MRAYDASNSDTDPITLTDDELLELTLEEVDRDRRERKSLLATETRTNRPYRQAEAPIIAFKCGLDWCENALEDEARLYCSLEHEIDFLLLQGDQAALDGALASPDTALTHGGALRRLASDHPTLTPHVYAKWRRHVEDHVTAERADYLSLQDFLAAPTAPSLMATDRAQPLPSLPLSPPVTSSIHVVLPAPVDDPDSIPLFALEDELKSSGHWPSTADMVTPFTATLQQHLPPVSPHSQRASKMLAAMESLLKTRQRADILLGLVACWIRRHTDLTIEQVTNAANQHLGSHKSMSQLYKAMKAAALMQDHPELRDVKSIERLYFLSRVPKADLLGALETGSLSGINIYRGSQDDLAHAIKLAQDARRNNHSRTENSGSNRKLKANLTRHFDHARVQLEAARSLAEGADANLAALIDRLLAELSEANSRLQRSYEH